MIWKPQLTWPPCRSAYRTGKAVLAPFLLDFSALAIHVVNSASAKHAGCAIPFSPTITLLSFSWHYGKARRTVWRRRRAVALLKAVDREVRGPHGLSPNRFYGRNVPCEVLAFEARRMNVSCSVLARKTSSSTSLSIGAGFGRRSSGSTGLRWLRRPTTSRYGRSTPPHRRWNGSQNCATVAGEVRRCEER